MILFKKTIEDQYITMSSFFATFDKFKEIQKREACLVV